MKMPKDPIERTEDEFRQRMRLRKELKDSRDRFIQEELERIRKGNRNLAIIFLVLITIYSAIVIYFIST